MSAKVTLSDAKARLSELVRNARTQGEDAIITVDGEPAARLVPIEGGLRTLTTAEVAAYRAILSSLTRFDRPDDAFDAVELMGEGRR